MSIFQGLNPDAFRSLQELVRRPSQAEALQMMQADARLIEQQQAQQHEYNMAQEMAGFALEKETRARAYRQQDMDYEQGLALERMQLQHQNALELQRSKDAEALQRAALAARTRTSRPGGVGTQRPESKGKPATLRMGEDITVRTSSGSMVTRRGGEMEYREAAPKSVDIVQDMTSGIADPQKRAVVQFTLANALQSGKATDINAAVDDIIRVGQIDEHGPLSDAIKQMNDAAAKLATLREDAEAGLVTDAELKEAEANLEMLTMNRNMQAARFGQMMKMKQAALMDSAERERYADPKVRATVNTVQGVPMHHKIEAAESVEAMGIDPRSPEGDAMLINIFRAMGYEVPAMPPPGATQPVQPNEPTITTPGQSSVDRKPPQPDALQRTVRSDTYATRSGQVRYGTPTYFQPNRPRH